MNLSLRNPRISGRGDPHNGWKLPHFTHFVRFVRNDTGFAKLEARISSECPDSNYRLTRFCGAQFIYKEKNRSNTGHKNHHSRMGDGSVGNAGYSRYGKQY